jgi:hypothetical protein
MIITTITIGIIALLERLAKLHFSTSTFGFRRFPSQLSSNHRAAGETIANLNFQHARMTITLHVIAGRCKAT